MSSDMNDVRQSYPYVVEQSNQQGRDLYDALLRELRATGYSGEEAATVAQMAWPNLYAQLPKDTTPPALAQQARQQQLNSGHEATNDGSTS